MHCDSWNVFSFHENFQFFLPKSFLAKVENLKTTQGIRKITIMQSKLQLADIIGAKAFARKLKVSVFLELDLHRPIFEVILISSRY